MTSSTALEVLGKHAATLQFGVFKNIGICTWHGQATRASVGTLTDIVDKLLTSDSQVFSFVHIVPKRVPLPDAKGRAGLVALMNRYEERTACAAIVVGGAGFWASSMRSAVTGLRLLVPRSFEYRLHGKTSEVAYWLPEEHARRTGVRITPLELMKALSGAEAW